MCRIAFCGLGKLGFPCALAAATKHDVVGYDVSPAPREILRTRKYPHREALAQEFLEATTLRIVDSVEEAVAHAEVVFVAVPTPHKPEFEGITPMPDLERADFDYTALREAVRSIAEAAARLRKPIVLAVISTVLPGTSRRELYPLLNEWTAFAYNPFFIAMSTTIADYLHPEFILLGVDADRPRGREAADAVRAVYAALTDAEVVEMSVPSAELAKVAYNVSLGLKIIAANSYMEIAHKTGANCDDVTRALVKATDRVVSSKYMLGGMGDGGGCLTPESMVYAGRGWRPISAVVAGDLVFDGVDFGPVEDVYKRPYKGEVLAIQVRGMAPQRFTVEQPFIAIIDGCVCEARAMALKIGDELLFPETPPPGADLPTGRRPIESIRIDSFEGTVWNLNRRGTHRYLTGAGLVNNCHPRDQIALSWLSRELGIGYDLFGHMVRIREAQTQWLAHLCIDEAHRRQLRRIIILGKAYKAQTNLTVGSPAILLKHYLDLQAGWKVAKEIIQWDPHVDGPVPPCDFAEPAVFFVGTDHPEFYDDRFRFPTGSVIIDPWGRMPDRAGVEVVRVGRR